MKILQVVRQYLPSTGGMETYVSSLNRQLVRRGHHVDVATLDYIFKTNEPLPGYDNIDGIDIIRFHSSGTPRYFFAPRLLEAIPRYDLVHVHGVDFFIDLLGTMRKVHDRPVILSTHGGFFHTPWYPWLKKLFFNTMTRFSLRGVDRIIASSPKDEELFSQITGKVSLVENGIDYPAFSSVGKDIRGEKIVFVGRLSKNKRVDRLLEVFARVKKERPKAVLVIIGPDWEGLRSGLEQQAAGLGISDAVTFTGEISQEEMLAALRSAKLFASASDYEAFGLSAVEAMATGTVTVLNRIPAFTGILFDGSSGLLADYGDTEDAARTIIKALSLPGGELEKIGGKAKEEASRYDWNSVADAIVNIYEQVLAAHER